MSTLFVVILTVFSAILWASVFEWTLHREVMHKKVKIFDFEFDYAYEAHALVHHGQFRSDSTYHLVDPQKQEPKKIPMAWWNGPVLVLISTIPFDILGFLLHRWSIPLSAMATIACYYGVYEYIHWCMHLPKARRLEFWEPFRRLNGHHLLHHRYPDKNLNVVLPFADWLFGTLLLRAKQPFSQPRGQAVPDVQPLSTS